MTKTPQQIKNEVEKGCGIFLYEDEFGDKDDLFNHDGMTEDGIAEAFIEFAKKEKLSFF